MQRLAARQSAGPIKSGRVTLGASPAYYQHPGRWTKAAEIEAADIIQWHPQGNGTLRPVSRRSGALSARANIRVDWAAAAQHHRAAGRGLRQSGALDGAAANRR